MKKKLICVITSISLILIALLVRITTNYKNSCNIYAEHGVKGDITRDINQSIAEKLKKTEKLNFKTVAYKSNGNIDHIDINSSLLNEICNELSSEIYDLIKSKNTQYGMPLGNTLGTPRFSGKGYKITFEVLTVSYVEFDISSELLSGGINQTIHRISAQFIAKLRCMAPFHNVDIEICIPVILSETLIVGNVPLIFFSS